MSKPSKFAHIVYRTRRFDELIDWYRMVFEAKVQYQNDGLAFLTYDDEHHRIALANLDAFAPGIDGPEHPAGSTVEHVAYTYASLADLMETYARLKQLGIKPYWAIHHGVTISFYYADPDGNQMEFQVDCFDSVDEANRYMQGDAFAANPLGVEIDPEAILAGLGAGASAAQFQTRPAGPMSPIRSALNPRPE